MLSHQPIRIKNKTTRGIVLMAAWLSLFTFSGLDSRGLTQETQSAKTEWVAKVSSRHTRVAFYKIPDERCLFSFYPFREIEFLRFQNKLIDIRTTSMIDQLPGVRKIFSRHHQIYSPRSSEDDVIKSLRG